jgi:hypothetical protein
MNEKQITPTQPEPDAVILPIGLVNDILNYMNLKPWGEVNNLIIAVQKNAQPIFTKVSEKDAAEAEEIPTEEVKTEEVKA